MFIAGFLPGAVMAGGLLLMNYVRCKRRGYHGSSEPLSLLHAAITVDSATNAAMAPSRRTFRTFIPYPLVAVGRRLHSLGILPHGR